MLFKLVAVLGLAFGAAFIAWWFTKKLTERGDKDA